jgi:hypothetical protein
MAATTSSRAAGFRLATATRAPSRASDTADARPKPRDAAVTSARLPVKPRSMDSGLSALFPEVK